MKWQLRLQQNQIKLFLLKQMIISDFYDIVLFIMILLILFIVPNCFKESNEQPKLIKKQQPNKSIVTVSDGESEDEPVSEEEPGSGEESDEEESEEEPDPEPGSASGPVVTVPSDEDEESDEEPIVSEEESDEEPIVSEEESEEEPEEPYFGDICTEIAENIVSMTEREIEPGLQYYRDTLGQEPYGIGVADGAVDQIVTKCKPTAGPVRLPYEFYADDIDSIKNYAASFIQGIVVGIIVAYTSILNARQSEIPWHQKPEIIEPLKNVIDGISSSVIKNILGKESWDGTLGAPANPMNTVTNDKYNIWKYYELVFPFSV